MHTVYSRIIRPILTVTLLCGILPQGAATEERTAESESAAPDNALAQGASFPRNPSDAQQVAMLENESLDQTLFRLKNVNLFFSPGPIEPGCVVWAGTQILPLSDKSELFSVEVMMGNRRVLKLYEELAALPEDSAANRVNEKITALLAEYRTMYAADEEINSPDHFTIAGMPWVRAHAHNSVCGVAYVTNTPNPNDVTLSGLRYAVLSLVWVAGALGLEGVNESIVMIAEEGIRQRDKVYEDKIHHDAHRESVLKYLSLYNRTILGNALLGTSSRLREHFERTRDRDLESRTIRRRKFDELYGPHKLGPDQALESDVTIDFRLGFTDPMIDDFVSMSQDQSR